MAAARATEPILRLPSTGHVLRPLSASDKAALIHAVNNPNVADTLSDALPFPYGPADADWYINFCNDAANWRYAPVLARPVRGSYVLADAASDEVIGSVGVKWQVGEHRRTLMLGYYLREDWWGKGVMSEAVREFVAWIWRSFGDGGYDGGGAAEGDLGADWDGNVLRVKAEIFGWNAKSARVLQKAGAVFEATERCAVIKRGRVGDLHVYAWVRPGW